MPKYPFIKGFICMIAMSLFMASCDLFKVDQEFIVKNDPEVSMLFVVPTAALPVTPAGTQGTLDQTTPNSYLLYGRFPIEGSTDVTVQFDSDDISKITVSAYRAFGTPAAIQRELRAEIPVANRTAKITLPLNTLNFGNTPVPPPPLVGTPPVVGPPSVTTGTTLEIVATTVSGKTFTRLFTINRL
ncbi:MAG: hypothetical protein H7Y04_07690 [Verrucomicrobia bacterium]|nr:hypothetical protein [Cytophagales bacterium]